MKHTEGHGARTIDRERVGIWEGGEGNSEGNGWEVTEG